MDNRTIVLVLSAVLIAAAVSGCVQEISEIGTRGEMPQPNITPTAATPISTSEASADENIPSIPLGVDLSISNAPALNETAELTCTVIYVSSACNTTTHVIPNITAQIGLPEGFVLVSGNLSWSGDIIVSEEEKLKHPLPTADWSTPEGARVWREYRYPQGQSEFSVVVKAVKMGNWTIAAIAEDRKPGHHRYIGRNHVYVGVREDMAWIRDTDWPAPVNNWGDMVLPYPSNNQQIESELLFSTTPEMNKEITITYRVTPSIDIPRAHMWLNIPPKGFELVNAQLPLDGEISRGLTWVGSIKKGQTVEINTTFKITSTGWGPVGGSLDVQRGGEIADTILDVKMADLSVNEEGGKITPRELKPYEAPPDLVEDFHVAEPVVTPDLPDLPPDAKKN